MTLIERLRGALLDRDNYPHMDTEIRVRVGLAREAADALEAKDRENAALRKQSELHLDAYNALADKHYALAADNERLREWIAGARHHDSCNVVRGDEKCICGRNAALNGDK